jgi:hypothetical protein
MLGAAIHWVLRMFSVILATFYYIIGPLALVAGMPRISGVGSKWFGHFVTVRGGSPEHAAADFARLRRMRIGGPSGQNSTYPTSLSI